MSEEASLWTLFSASFLAATLLPGGSEAVLFGVLRLHPEQFWPALGVAVVMVLTFRLSSQFKRLNAAVQIGLLVALVWTAVMGSVIFFNAGDTISPFVVALAFLPATAWIVCSRCAAPLNTAVTIETSGFSDAAGEVTFAHLAPEPELTARFAEWLCWST